MVGFRVTTHIQRVICNTITSFICLNKKGVREREDSGWLGHWPVSERTLFRM